MEAHISVIDSWLKLTLPVMTSIALTQHFFPVQKTVTRCSPFLHVAAGTNWYETCIVFYQVVEKVFFSGCQRLKGEGLFSHNKIIPSL